MNYRHIIFSASCIFIASCADIDKAGSDFLSSETATYTLTNLHPDPSTNKMYTTNFIQNGLIPRCSELKINPQSGVGALKFSYNDAAYVYKLQTQTTPEGWDKNTKKYFGSICNADTVKKLSQIDQAGISKGKVLVGMSKQGVIYAIGYPPETDTPNLNTDNSWKYWINRYTPFFVNFDSSGKVAQLENFDDSIKIRQFK